MIRLIDIYQPPRFNGECAVSFSRIRAAMEEDQVNMSPSYQRGHRWTKDQQEAYMGHFLTGGLVAPIIVNREEASIASSEVLDGKQRLTAMYAWLDGKIGAQVNGNLLFRSEVSHLNGVYVMVRYIDLPFAERKAFYVKFNSAGTPHTKEEIAAALAATE